MLKWSPSHREKAELFGQGETISSSSESKNGQTSSNLGDFEKIDEANSDSDKGTYNPLDLRISLMLKLHIQEYIKTTTPLIIP